MAKDFIVRDLVCPICGKVMHIPPTPEDIAKHSGHIRMVLGPIEEQTDIRSTTHLGAIEEKE